MQAIQTKFLSPTNNNGSRVKARAQSGSVTIDWDHALNIEDNHKAAAEKLVKKLKWNMEVIPAGVLHDHSHVFMVKYKNEEV